MSAGILRALMQLFAIIAREAEAADQASNGRDIVAVFLRQQLNRKLVEQYMVLFDAFVADSGKGRSSNRKAKRTSLSSVKVLRICTQINEELAQKEKLFVLIRLIEFVESFGQRGDQQEEFLETVADTFNVGREVYKNLSALCRADDLSTIYHSDFLRVDGALQGETETRHLTKDGMEGMFLFYRLESEHMFLVRYKGTEEVLLNGQAITDSRAYIFMQGASLRGSRFSPLYYSDVIQVFLADSEEVQIQFQAENLSYYFPNGHQGLHQLNIRETSGNLIGIMGASGSGKSTLLNVLNGNYVPTYGSVTINGIDVHHNKQEIDGLLGYVAQDDLLIEELTVFQNLYYNAKLCFADQTDEAVAELVDETLQSLGLYEARDLKVGSPLEKTISGGQRKRLNIALELIREPAVLFVDEPTSGLSSRDSENIMDLLKELTLKGKLIFTVIHQPSSDIFKMFDKLFLLDTGGYPIYYGNPVESIIYFKRLVNHVNVTESECNSCGNVNPEQVFNMIESKVVDEYGNLTQHRKISPREWNNFFNVMIANRLEEREPVREVPRSAFRVPNRWRQFNVFAIRDVLSKLANRQYMLINFLEAPLLAMVLSFFIKYFKPAGQDGEGYSFMDNDNLPQFLFISVIVALFLGLTVSAEEIIRDKKILKREKFLNLSRSSYLFSKIGIMFAISAVQMLTFVLVASLVLDIRDMGFSYWLVLFSTSCFANLLGLNISASFNSAKVIYILIPVLIIPQLLFSGVIVKFDKLHPWFASQSGVPVIGNIMASRWAYEALAVNQYVNNPFEQQTYLYDSRMKTYKWRQDVWVKNAMKTKLSEARRLEKTKDEEKSAYLQQLFLSEFEKVSREVSDLPLPWYTELQQNGFSPEVTDGIDSTLSLLTRYYMRNYNALLSKRERVIASLTQTPELREQWLEERDAFQNRSLQEFVTNSNELTSYVEHGGSIIQKKDLIYLDPIHSGFFGAHFYAPSKNCFGLRIPTLQANLMVLWGMTLLLVLALFADGLSRLLIGFQTVSARLVNRLFGKSEEFSEENV